MKKLLVILALVPCLAFAQRTTFESADVKAFEHLEIGENVGTTGVGIDLATPINKHLKVRVGVSYMPKVGDVATYSMAAVNGSVDLDMDYKTNHLAEYLQDMVHNPDIDNKVDMKRQIGFINAKAILDWYPFHKKNWHFSAGFYVGSRKVGEVCNTPDEAPTMLAMLMYNDMYDQIQTLGPYDYPTFNLGKYSFEMDPVAGKQLKSAFNVYGRVAVQLGTYPDGTPHYLAPDPSGFISADAKVNAFKPYVGFGYNTAFGHDSRWNFGFDAGMMFWGTPHIVCNDGVCLVHDVKNIGGIVGKYISFAKKMPLYPVIEVKLAYTMF